MRNTGYNKLQLILIAVKDWGNFLKLGEIPPSKKAYRNTLFSRITLSFTAKRDSLY